MNKNDMHIEMLKLTYANGIWETCVCVCVEIEAQTLCLSN